MSDSNFFKINITPNKSGHKTPSEFFAHLSVFIQSVFVLHSAFPHPDINKITELSYFLDDITEHIQRKKDFDMYTYETVEQVENYMYENGLEQLFSFLVEMR